MSIARLTASGTRRWAFWFALHLLWMCTLGTVMHTHAPLPTSSRAPASIHAPVAIVNPDTDCAACDWVQGVHAAALAVVAFFSSAIFLPLIRERFSVRLLIRRPLILGLRAPPAPLFAL